MSEILNQVLEQIIPIMIVAIVTVLAVIIKGIGSAAVKFIEVKKEELITKIGAEKYQHEKEIAFDIWNVVEEHFRISEKVENTMNEKIDMFDKLIKEKIPYVTDEQIIMLRQAIAGEVNKFKDAILE